MVTSMPVAAECSSTAMRRMSDVFELHACISSQVDTPCNMQAAAGCWAATGFGGDYPEVVPHQQQLPRGVAAASPGQRLGVLQEYGNYFA